MDAKRNYYGTFVGPWIVFEQPINSVTALVGAYNRISGNIVEEWLPVQQVKAALTAVINVIIGGADSGQIAATLFTHRGVN